MMYAKERRARAMKTGRTGKSGMYGILCTNLGKKIARATTAAKTLQHAIIKRLNINSGISPASSHDLGKIREKIVSAASPPKSN